MLPNPGRAKRKTAENVDFDGIVSTEPLGRRRLPTPPGDQPLGSTKSTLAVLNGPG